MNDSRQKTEEHIQNVRQLLERISENILIAAKEHDQSKLQSPEVEIFDEYTPKLSTCEYGSPEYHSMLKEMQIALDHHYANNRHHPEYHSQGIQSMTLVDLIEMLTDWKAASMRHETGDIYKSLEINQGRFDISQELMEILLNTVKAYFE